MDNKKAIQAYILREFNEEWEEQPQMWNLFGKLITEKDIPNLQKYGITKLNDLLPYAYDLKERGYLEEEDMSWRITKEGRDVLTTEFNPNYIRKKQTEKLVEKGKERKAEQTETKRHNEMVKIAKDANKWNKWGIIFAIMTGVSGLIISIISILS